MNDPGHRSKNTNPAVRDGLWLGLDVGTQGTKALLVLGDGTAMEVVGRGYASYGLVSTAAGVAEQDPQLWLDGVRVATAEAAVRAGAELKLDSTAVLAKVCGVGVSGQQHGLVVLDGGGQPVRPAKLWCDTSTTEAARDLAEELGRPVPVGFTASKVRWLAQQEPEVWAAVRHVMLPHDFINYRLTGRLTAERGDGSGTGWFDPVNGTWDAAAMQAIDARLSELVAPVLPVGACAGTTQASVQPWLGLGAGVPVSAGGGDNMLSAIGSGAVEPGPVVMSLGTSGTVFTYRSQPVADPHGLIAPFLGSAGGALPLLCVMNCTGVLEEVVRAFGQSHDQLTALASTLDPGALDLHPQGLLWLPLLGGERTPDLPQAAGRLLGMRPGALDPGRLYRAAIEGVSLLLASATDRLRDAGSSIDRVRLVGGAANNPLWQQVLADTVGADVQCIEEPESAAFGAALQARWSVMRLGDPDASMAAMARDNVGLAESVSPSGAQGVYAGLRERFDDELAAEQTRTR